MELRHLRYFVAVAEEMNIHRAAKRLNISQPPLSLSIKQLEDEIDASLFTREGRGIQITRAGEVFLERARTILAQSREAAHEARQIGQGSRGTLKIGFVSSAVTGILQEKVASYRRQHPDVQLDIRQSVGGFMAERVLNKDLDIGLLRLPEYLPDTIGIKELPKESWIIALPKAHRLAKAKDIRLKDLTEENLIFYPRYNNPAGYDDVMAMFREKDIEPRIYQEAPEQMTIAGLVASGMGIGIVPECMARIKVAGVVHKPLREGKGRTGFALIYRLGDDALVRQFLS